MMHFELRKEEETATSVSYKIGVKTILNSHQFLDNKEPPQYQRTYGMVVIDKSTGDPRFIPEKTDHFFLDRSLAYLPCVLSAIRRHRTRTEPYPAYATFYGH